MNSEVTSDGLYSVPCS